jgi:oxygen-dependent protoporphyrinogen oxidase
LEADAVILALPHEVNRQVLGQADFLKPLNDRPTSVATVLLAFSEETAPKTKEGTGFLIPRVEPYTITACTWTHKKWPHTTPAGQSVASLLCGACRR